MFQALFQIVEMVPKYLKQSKWEGNTEDWERIQVKKGQCLFMLQPIYKNLTVCL